MSKKKKSPVTEPASDTFEVGRGKPPRHTRFKPGQSGNPGGRRKGSRNLKTVLEAVLSSEIEITEGGKKRQVSIIEALIKRQVQEGLRGQLRAIENLLDRYEQHLGPEAEPDEELAEEDQAILARMLSSRVPATMADRQPTAFDKTSPPLRAASSARTGVEAEGYTEEGDE